MAQRFDQTDGQSILILAGHQCDARVCAERRIGVTLREARPFHRHAVDFRGAIIGLAAAAQISVAAIVDHNENDVGSGVMCQGEKLRSEGASLLRLDANVGNELRFRLAR